MRGLVDATTGDRAQGVLLRGARRAGGAMDSHGCQARHRDHNGRAHECRRGRRRLRLRRSQRCLRRHQHHHRCWIRRHCRRHRRCLRCRHCCPRRDHRRRRRSRHARHNSDLRAGGTIEQGYPGWLGGGDGTTWRRRLQLQPIVVLKRKAVACGVGHRHGQRHHRRQNEGDRCCGVARRRQCRWHLVCARFLKPGDRALHRDGWRDVNGEGDGVVHHHLATRAPGERQRLATPGGGLWRHANLKVRGRRWLVHSEQ